MYAIVKSGGHQYRVAEGETVEIERLTAAVGDTVTLDEVLLVAGGKKGIMIGQPHVAGASVKATVVAEIKGEKIVVFKYKPKKRYRVKTGHRQKYTRLMIDSITA